VVGIFLGRDMKGRGKTLLCAGIEEVPARGDFLVCEIRILQRGDAVWPDLRESSIFYFLFGLRRDDVMFRRYANTLRN
jgi:hypothetical protein